MDITIELSGLKSKGWQVEQALFKKLDELNAQATMAKKAQPFNLEGIVIIRHDDASVNFFETKDIPESRHVLVRITADANVLETVETKALEFAIDQIGRDRKYVMHFRYPPMTSAVQSEKPSRIRRLFLKAASFF